jgi:hypothetical protein
MIPGCDNIKRQPLVYDAAVFFIVIIYSDANLLFVLLAPTYLYLAYKTGILVFCAGLPGCLSYRQPDLIFCVVRCRL